MPRITPGHFQIEIDQLELIVRSREGFDINGFTEVDVRNYAMDMREGRIGREARKMIEYFKTEKDKVIIYIYASELDGDHPLLRNPDFKYPFMTNIYKAETMMEFEDANVNALPEQYIFKRWCQTVRQRRGGSRYKPWHGESGMLASRYAELFSMATGLVESGLCSDESYIMVREAMATLQTRLDNLKLKNVEDGVDDEGGWNHNHPWGHLMTLFKIQVKPEQKAGPAE